MTAAPIQTRSAQTPSGGGIGRRSAAILLLTPALIALTIAFVLPMGWLLRMSLNLSEAGVITPALSLATYRSLLTDTYYLGLLADTLRLSAITSVSALLLAYPVARWQVVLGKFLGHSLTLALATVIGFGIAGVAIAFSRFLQNGFLPLAVAFGAVPIVGLAPVLGRAFGVDWESKAAVVVIVTFFPVVLNTVQGLLQVDPVKLELLRAYAAKPYEVFLKVRLPNSLPYLFNALKVGVVVAVISVIVAEFLIPGPPRGLGQRISLSARQGAFDVAFAAIVVSSLFSILIYAFVSFLERVTTSWHASNRGEEG